MKIQEYESAKSDMAKICAGDPIPMARQGIPMRDDNRYWLAPMTFGEIEDNGMRQPYTQHRFLVEVCGVRRYVGHIRTVAEAKRLRAVLRRGGRGLRASHTMPDMWCVVVGGEYPGLDAVVNRL